MSKLFLFFLLKPLITVPQDLSWHHYNQIGERQLTSKDFKGALKSFNKALEIDSSQFLIYYNRGFLQMITGGYNDAIADFTKVITLNPVFGLAYKNRGIAKFLNGQKKDAELDFYQAEKLGTNTKNAVMMLDSLGIQELIKELNPN